MTQEHAPATRKQLVSNTDFDLERDDDTATALKQGWCTQGNTDIQVPPGAAKIRPKHETIQPQTTEEARKI